MLQVIKVMGQTYTEKRVLNDAIRATIQMHPGGGWVDSHKVAYAILHRRHVHGKKYVSGQQTKDYVQHVFREASHMCRHADGHMYRIHAEEVCSPECEEIYAINPKIVRRESCPQCFLEVTTAGECPMGC